jgi:hypothetical protein
MTSEEIISALVLYAEESGNFTGRRFLNTRRERLRASSALVTTLASFSLKKQFLGEGNDGRPRRPIREARRIDALRPEFSALF